jgi:hypothetical protein
MRPTGIGASAVWVTEATLQVADVEVNSVGSAAPATIKVVNQSATETVVIMRLFRESCG